MIISQIVAASTNNVIGKDNQLMWHLPLDLKFFKDTTWGMPIAMGRKSFDALGCKPLNGRLNIIITRQNNFEAKGVVVVNTIEEAIEVAAKADYKELFIGGGGQIYQAAMPITHNIYLTRVHAKLDGDAYFPVIDTNQFALVKDEPHKADAKHQYDFNFQLWQRK